MHNPWRLSFDSEGRLFAADVGEHLFEWVNLVEEGGNYGWPITEGSHGFDPDAQWRPTGDSQAENDRGKPLLDPIVEYPTSRTPRRSANCWGPAGGVLLLSVFDGQSRPGMVLRSRLHPRRLIWVVVDRPTRSHWNRSTNRS